MKGTMDEREKEREKAITYAANCCYFDIRFE